MVNLAYLAYAVTYGCVEEGEERNGEEIPLIWGDLSMHEAKPSYWITYHLQSH